MVGVAGGVTETEYNEINHQLEIRHLSGSFAKHDNAYGLDGVIVYKNRVVLIASVLFFGALKREGEIPYPSEMWVTLKRSTVMGRMGIIPFPIRTLFLYPFIGLASETIEAANGFRGMLKRPDLLFNGYKPKKVHNLTLRI
ncbi:hypothetical protein JW824_14405 [bacterium]|nr:hypothetical protein [bacterium]